MTVTGQVRSQHLPEAQAQPAGLSILQEAVIITHAMAKPVSLRGCTQARDHGKIDPVSGRDTVIFRLGDTKPACLHPAVRMDPHGFHTAAFALRHINCLAGGEGCFDDGVGGRFTVYAEINKDGSRALKNRQADHRLGNRLPGLQNIRRIQAFILLFQLFPAFFLL